MEQLTHWKKYKNPDYLGAYSFNDPKQELILSIREARTESVASADGSGKKSDCLVVHWNESAKPMIVNTTNAKAISKVAGSPYVEKWKGVHVQIYIAKIRAFGEDVEALRIRQTKPNVPTAKPTFDEQEIKDQFDLLTDIESLAKYWAQLPKEIAQTQSIIDYKNQCKAKLEGGK